MADGKHVHVHAVDKWDFVAFPLDGSSRREIQTGWRVRKQRSRRL